MQEIKAVMKEDLPEWTHHLVMGKMVPISEADATTVIESAAIEWCHRRAAEMGIVLRES